MSEGGGVRHCYHCANMMTCFRRIDMAVSNQRFKLLAENPDEAANNDCTNTTQLLWIALAGCCTQWREKGDAI